MMRNNMIEYINRQIEERQEAIRVFESLPVSYIEECFPQGEWHYDWIGNFEFRMPYAQEWIEIVKQFMVDQLPFWEQGREFQCVWDSSSGAGFFITYHSTESRRLKFDFAFRSSVAGSTCVLNKIGEKTVPVFEVVCSQQAADEF
jgi:hypothetical protein